jgi:hypothetical protein
VKTGVAVTTSNSRIAASLVVFGATMESSWESPAVPRPSPAPELLLGPIAVAMSPLLRMIPLEMPSAPALKVPMLFSDPVILTFVIVAPGPVTAAANPPPSDRRRCSSRSVQMQAPQATPMKAHAHSRLGITHLPVVEGKLPAATIAGSGANTNHGCFGIGVTGFAFARERQSLRSWDTWRIRW